MDTIARAVNILRRGGPSRLYKSVRDWFRYHPPLWQHRLQFRSWVQRRRDESIADPFKVVWINPNRIEHVTRFNSRRYAGTVMAGDWDQTDQEFKEIEQCRGLYERFVGGHPWKETKYFENAVDKIDRHGHCYGCWSPEEFLEKRCSYLDDLYESIEKDGYKTQAEINEDERAQHRHPQVDAHSSFHEIAVSIGRDGEMFFDRGKHRLIIAQILELDSIPVQIVVRHEKWQEYRRDIYRGETVDDRDYHPDLNDVITSEQAQETQSLQTRYR